MLLDCFYLCFIVSLHMFGNGMEMGIVLSESYGNGNKIQPWYGNGKEWESTA